MLIKDINDQPVFIVKPRTHHSIDEIYAIFDSEVKAEKFINRFKTKEQDLVIVRQMLNPSYFADDNSDPYFVALDKTSFSPKEIFICSTITMVEDAKNEAYSIFFHHINDDNEGEFIFQCMAADKNEALNKAVAKRDFVINNGDWDKALEQHILKARVSK